MAPRQEKGKHTEGPWEYRKQAMSPAGTRNLYGVGPVQDGAVWFVAENLSEDDARLISQAPDLLQALRDLREAVTDAYKAGRIPAEPFVRAGNVIARATGE